MGLPNLSNFSTVTLIGAHSLGHVHTTASGYGLPPTTPASKQQELELNSWDITPATFDNKYYISLLTQEVSFLYYLDL